MNNKQKLELTWIGKEKRPKPELETKRSKLRRELFTRQDEVETQRNATTSLPSLRFSCNSRLRNKHSLPSNGR
jgi:hypothetical protein